MKPEQTNEQPSESTSAPATQHVAVVAEPISQPKFGDVVRPFLEANCFDCHSGEFAEEGLDLSLAGSADDLRDDRSKWEKVLELVEIGAMPPADYAEPEEAEVAKVVDWLDYTLHHVDCGNSPDPGRVTVRRLNRTEYDNTVQDLFGIDFEPSKDFPSDEVGYGFDNIGDVLTVPPLLLEKYLDAAEQVADNAILTGDPDLEIQTKGVPGLKGRGGAYADKGGGQIVCSSEGNTARWDNARFDRSGRYVLKVDVRADQAGSENARVAVKVGGKSLGEYEITKKDEEVETIEIEGKFEAGKRPVEVTFLNDFYREQRGDRNVFVHSIQLVGPYGIDSSRLPKSHKQLTSVRPSDGRSVQRAAAENLAPLIRRAFRRQVSNAEVEPYAKFAALAVERGESFDDAMKIAVQAVLVSPQFLFRIEGDDGSTGLLARQLNGFEIATRLSYFLWNSTPDDRLLELAEGGSLTRPKVLDGEVRRMLEDPRSDEMIENFVGQWLGLRKLGEMQPDRSKFKSFKPEIMDDMRQETRQFVQHVIREGRPISELLSARYTFLNERLAKHYDINGVKGDHFRKVELSSGDNVYGQRAGLLTHGSILLLTSYPNRTSPVRRGEWVLANILGDEPPPAPPNVPTLEETQAEHADLSLREQMAKHREDPSCAACHKTMDAIGFGFENFDAVGRWRDRDGKFDVDAAGELPAKRDTVAASFDSPGELIDILSGREDAFVRTVSEKLLTFALGRGVTYADKCSLDDITDAAAKEGNTFAGIVSGIVLSDAFRLQGGRLRE